MVKLLRGNTLIFDKAGLTETAPLPGLIDNMILIGLTAAELKDDYPNHWAMIYPLIWKKTQWIEI